jgi:HEAT repeat protein
LIVYGKVEVAVAELAELLADPDGKVRGFSVVALNNAGTPAVPFLLRALVDDDAIVRAAAAQACGLPDPRTPRRFSSADDEILMSHLTQKFSDPDARVREAAAEASSFVCPGANEEAQCIGALCACLSDRDERVRGAAAMALSRIAKYARDPRLFYTATFILTDKVRNDSEYVRKRAEWALSQISAVK